MSKIVSVSAGRCWFLARRPQALPMYVMLSNVTLREEFAAPAVISEGKESSFAQADSREKIMNGISHQLNYR